MTPGELIENYLKLRERKKEVEDRHTTELLPYKVAMSKIEDALGRLMDEMDLDNLPGKGGTAYTAIRTTVKVDDWDAYFNWVREGERWHMLERRAAKTAVEEVVAETKELPPGLSITRDRAVHVRKS